MKYTFVPEYEALTEFTPVVNDFRYEPMLFGADLNFAEENAGPLTKQLLTLVSEQTDNEVWNERKKRCKHTVVDTRVTMLMPGMYPSIPGWHCDDVQRFDGQPHLTASLPSYHVMALVADKTGCSRTEFITEPFTTVIDPKDVWQTLNTNVEANMPASRFLKENILFSFDRNTIHRASPANTAGWRFFFRVSMGHRVPKNEIRKQVQIYVDPAKAGW